MISMIKKFLGFGKQEKTENLGGGDYRISGIQSTAYGFFTGEPHDERQEVLEEAIQGANRDQKAILEAYEKKYAGVR